MNRPCKGVILSLEHFAIPVKHVAHTFINRKYGIGRQQAPITTDRRIERLMYALIAKLLEDIFLVHVMQGKISKKQFLFHGEQRIDLEFRNWVSDILPNYEILFSSCFHGFVRMQHLPDQISLDLLDNDVIITWDNK